MNMIARCILALATVVTTVMLTRGCSQEQPGNPNKDKGTPKVSSIPDDKVWTAEEVAGDPTSYMNWADSRIGRQIEDRQKRISSIAGKIKDVELRYQLMRDNLSDTSNIKSRMEMAIRRAEDEDRWPIQMAGRSFDKTEANKIIAQTTRYLEDRKPLASAYDQAIERLSGMHGVLSREIGELNRLREKMALDLEAVKLTQGLEDLDKLRKTEANIAGYAKALGSMADDSLIDAFPDTKDSNSKVDIDTFMK